jgi:hypothetical protein
MRYRPTDDELARELYDFLRQSRRERETRQVEEDRQRRLQRDAAYEEAVEALRQRNEEEDEHSWLDDIDWNEIAAGAGFTIGGPLLEEFIEKKKAEDASGVIGRWIKKLF